MCTLTWWQGPEGRYEVFFNRDELKDREPAWPPREAERDGVRYLAPIDPRAGGTWLMVNEAGITVALLNWYERSGAMHYPPEWGSRGELVLSLAGMTSGAALRERLAAIDGGAYPPFHLVAFVRESAGGLAVSGWQGRGTGAVEPMPVVMPVCSSSHDPATVIETRRRLLAAVSPPEGAPDPETLWAFHHGAGDGATLPGAWSVRMNRPDAQTWSISRISVGPEVIRFLYEAESPDLAGPVSRHEALLERRRAA